MKRRLTLPERPSVLYLIVLFDLFTLIAVYGLYGTNWISTTGVPIQLPESTVRNDLFVSGQSMIVKVTGAMGESFEIDQRIMGPVETQEYLAEKKEIGLKNVFLMIDQNLKISSERKVIDLLQKTGLDVILVSETN